MEFNLDKYAGKSYNELERKMSLNDTAFFFDDCKKFLLGLKDTKDMSFVDNQTIKNSVKLAKHHLQNFEYLQETAGGSEIGPNPLALTRKGSDNSGNNRKAGLNIYDLNEYIKLADESAIIKNNKQELIGKLGTIKKEGRVL